LFIKHKFSNNDFVYLDPPYYPINEKSFVSYQSEGFDKSCHDNLVKLCNYLNKNKIKFIHSNSCTQYNLDNYKKYNIKKLSCKRRINSKNPESKEMEVIISN